MILATGNEHKVREMAQILPDRELRALPPEVELPPETGTTFEENALIKARAARAATGEPVIADDSGLEVDALDGRPGVYSARFAGPDASDRENLERLLAELGKDEGSAAPRTARYVCVIALIDGSGEHLFRGTCEGEITKEPRGTGGFGYDPAFVPDATGPEDSRTMAELDPDEKHAISHRGDAARRLAAHLSA